MLDISHAATIADVWNGLEIRADLPGGPEDFYGKSGTKPSHDMREFDRHYLRCEGIVRRELETFGVFMRDCSRAGMGLISPVQFFPRERIQLWMKPERSYTLEIVRCRKIKENCYECGSIFIVT